MIRIVVASGKGGTGKTLVATTGAELALLVAEPTFLGVHDLESILKVALRFGRRCW